MAKLAPSKLREFRGKAALPKSVVTYGARMVFMSQRFYLLFILFFSMSCAQFETGRSFFTEMSHDDSRFFSPREDFPVVAGDSGRDWNTDKEMRKRTPASELDVLEMKRARLFERELAELEDSQTSHALKFYEKYKHRFTTTSEKIYFLELPYEERRDYLVSKGFIEQPKPQALSRDRRMAAVAQNDILSGMKKTDVIESWGQPLKVDIAGDPRNENERWLYNSNGASKYIYFEAGQVQGWE
jgi:hypothetical protein